MRGISSWAYQPYIRLNELEAAAKPYICRIAPNQNGFCFEWFDKGYVGEHVIRYKRYKDLGPETELPVSGTQMTVMDLEEEQDYEFYLCRKGYDGASSAVRLVRTGFVPGAVVHYLHPEDTQYAFSGRSLCSPSIIKLPSGRLLASMDVFVGRGPQNLTLLFGSSDNGANWEYVTDLFPCFWGKLFCHRDKLYMLANTTEYGDLVIGCSVDEGRSWSKPVTILPGSGSWADKGPHKAPMPVIEHKGRLYTAIDYGSWSTGGHASGMLSIDSSSDPMVSEHWVCTPFLPYDTSWPGASKGRSGGCLEGNAVVSPDGILYNLLRYQITDADPNHDRAVLLRADLEDPEKPLTFEQVLDMPGGSNSKYDVLHDPVSGHYIALVSEIVNSKTPNQRNVLSMVVSKNLLQWRLTKRLLDYSYASSSDIGFQYISFLIDGNDIRYLSRTAFNRARNFHDANYITYHVLKDFRQYL